MYGHARRHASFPIALTSIIQQVFLSGSNTAEATAEQHNLPAQLCNAPTDSSTIRLSFLPVEVQGLRQEASLCRASRVGYRGRRRAPSFRASSTSLSTPFGCRCRRCWDRRRRWPARSRLPGKVSCSPCPRAQGFTPPPGGRLRGLLRLTLELHKVDLVFAVRPLDGRLPHRAAWKRTAGRESTKIMAHVGPA